MTTIYQLSKDELKDVIKSCLFEAMEELKKQSAPDNYPDQMGFSEACEFTRTSQEQMLKFIKLGKIPFTYDGIRQVFSRKDLTAWKERNGGTDKVYTHKQCEEYFNVERQTIHAWRKQGKIHGHVIGGRIYFLESELLATLKKQ